MFIGHKNGKISVWDEYLNNKLTKDYHKDFICKMIHKYVDQNTNYLVTASLDQTVCVINLDNNMEITLQQKFDFPIKDIYNIFDYENRDNFFIVLSNGNIVVLDGSFNQIFENKTKRNSINRKIIPLINNNKNDFIGDYLLISDNGFVDLFRWIKEDSFVTKKNMNHHNNHNNYRGRGKRGGY